MTVVSALSSADGQQAHANRYPSNVYLISVTMCAVALQDCLKAMGLPSLLGAGSRQFMAFVRHIKPEFESQLIYLDTLIADAQVRCHQARSVEWEANVGLHNI